MNEELSNHGLVDQPFAPYESETWVRNPEWLAMPTVLDTEYKVVLLYKVDPGTANFLSMLFNVSSGGTYTVDWGDGTSTSHSANTQCYKQYDFDAITGTPTSDGYKQVLVTITPTLITNRFLTIDIGKKHNQASLQIYSTNILDAVIAAPLTTTITLPTAGTNYHYHLERVQILSSSVASFANFCNSLTNLRSVYLRTAAPVVNTSYMFNGCRELIEVDIPTDYPSATTAAYMFQNCNKLVSAPNLTFAVCTDFTSMFSGCRLLRTAPNIGFPTSISIATLVCSNMFANCSSITTIPSYNTSRVTDCTSFFAGCFFLTAVPALDLSRVTTTTSMFNNCYSLKFIGTLTTTTRLTTVSSMFSGCQVLLNAPVITTTSAVTTVNSMFAACYALSIVPLYDFSAVTTATSMFSNCTNLRTLPLFNFAIIQSCTTMFNGCVGLTTIPAITFGTNSLTNTQSMFSGCTNVIKINATLSFTTNASTVTVSSMFSNCNNLIVLPPLNISANTSSLVATSMFSTCSSLTSVNNILFEDIVSAANVATILTNCTNLKQCVLTGLRFGSITIAGMLSAPALVELFTSLGTASGAQTLTVSGNWGWASLSAADKLIATSKGWTLA